VKTIALLAVLTLLAAGCSSSSGGAASSTSTSTGTGGAGSSSGSTGATASSSTGSMGSSGSSGSSTGSTGSSGSTGTGDGGGLVGPDAFPVTQTVASFTGLPDGGIDRTELLVEFFDGPGSCADYTGYDDGGSLFPDGGTALFARQVQLQLYKFDGGVTAGSYPLASFSDFENFQADGGGPIDLDNGVGIVGLDTPSTSLLSNGGTVTLASVRAARVAGSFSAVMVQADDGGSPRSLAGAFDTVCSQVQ
jgi:hypothetical protein